MLDIKWVQPQFNLNMRNYDTYLLRLLTSQSHSKSSKVRYYRKTHKFNSKQTQAIRKTLQRILRQICFPMTVSLLKLFHWQRSCMQATLNGQKDKTYNTPFYDDMDHTVLVQLLSCHIYRISISLFG